MGKLFSDSVVNEVLDRANIVEVIASYLPLKRAGRNYRAVCPFHPEKTPSFIVSADKQIFHCFGCGVGGNALTFIMQYEKVHFREALESLAQRAGIPLPEPDKTDFQKTQDDFKRDLLAVYEKARSFYHNNLLMSKEAQGARHYLQQRGISKETAEKFKLGYALSGWDACINALRTQGVSLSLLDKTGLVVSKEGGGYYDRFRSRIMFPIADAKDRVIAFGARVLDDSLPKYINSPETTLYSKGKNLFGLSLARDAIRTLDQVIVVEGYLDMMSPFEAGIQNIVASLGTALTADQIRLLKRTTNHVVMLYDSDLAGQLATLRALELLVKEDMDVRIACLPEGQDPDIFVRKAGKTAFLKIIEDAKPLFDYKLHYLISKFDMRLTSGKDKIVREILPTIKKFSNAVVRSEYIKQTAEVLQVHEHALWEDLKNVSEDAYESEGPESAAVSSYKLKEIPVTERMLVKLMLEEIHLIDELRLLISPSDFREEKLRKIVQFIFDFFTQGQQALKPNILMNYLGDDEAIGIISELATLEIHDCPNKEKLISDCVRRLKRDKLMHSCHELQKAIEAAQHCGNLVEIDRLILEYSSLIKQRSQFHGETSH